MDIQIGNPQTIYLLAVVAIVVVVMMIGVVARRRAVRAFATSKLRNHVMPAVIRRRYGLSTLLTSVSLALLAVALMDIRWGKMWQEVPQRGIEVMFALDVSRSMLAEDVSPNRLGRAKQQIKDMVDEMAGDRVGLVVFAGETRQPVPLTSHSDDFKQALDEVGPHSIRRGGSRLGDAIRAAAQGFIDKTNDHKAIVIFTDGEDQDSKPVEIAKQLYQDQGIRIFTVGLGDMDRGARIPETSSPSRRESYVEYQGSTVWSKMNGEVLRKIATETDGAYIPAGTKRVNMANVYHGYIANVEQTEFETAKINTYIPRFQWFAAPALVLLLLEVWISTHVPRRAGRDRIAKSEATDEDHDYEVRQQQRAA